MKKFIIFLTVSSVLLLFSYNSAQGFAIQLKGIVVKFSQPIHESITRKAAIDSGLLDVSQTEEIDILIEGVRFNDDPEGHTLKGNDTSLTGYRAARFGIEFLPVNSKANETDPTMASHFGVYQYIHAMGSADLSREEIKGKILRYFRHAWNMATDQNSFENFPIQYEIVKRQITEKKEHETIDQLSLRNSVKLFSQEILMFHAKNQLQLRYRAIGSMLHVIQDSYSKGHVVRQGWEDGEAWDDGENAGNILYFQDYAQQDKRKHIQFDRVSPWLKVDNFYTAIPGSTAAHFFSTELLSLIKNNCPWTSTKQTINSKCDDSVFGFLNDYIFALAELDSDEEGVTRSHPDIEKSNEVIPSVDKQ